MTFLAVNYHYFGSEDAYARGIYPVSAERFHNQMHALRRVFTFVSMSDVIRACNGEATLPEYSCLITLDDGLRCQIDIAWPILDELHIPAAFFLNALPYTKREVLLTHKIHWVRAHMAPEVFLRNVESRYYEMTGQMYANSQIVEDVMSVQNQYPYDSPSEAQLKYFLNKSTVPVSVRQAIIDSLFSDLVDEEDRFVESFYIQEEDVVQLARRDMLGLHGYSHRALAFLSDEELCHEVLDARTAIAEIAQREEKSLCAFSYPYGSPDLVSTHAARYLSGKGFKIGFSMERAFNQSLQDSLLFARLDANDVPEGKSPLFTIATSGGLTRTSDLLRERRDHFFQEQ